MLQNLLWTDKHRPKILDEIVGNRSIIESFKNWVLSWEKGIPDKKIAFLYGPPGVGKTIVVEALARELNLDLIEMNASDVRTAESIEKVIEPAVLQQSLFLNKKIILLDEIDGINSIADRGAFQTILRTVEKTNFPIVLTANDAWNPKLRGLREKSLLLKFKRIGARESIPYLKQLCDREGIDVDKKVLKLVIENNGGDLRSALNDLQMLSTGKNQLTYDDVVWLGWRDRKDAIFDALNLVFNSENCLNARKALDVADVGYEMLFEWIYENIPHQFPNPYDLSRGMSVLSKADLYLARTKGSQSWGLLSYVIDLMTAGVALSREGTKKAWIPMKFPQRISFRAKAMRERALLKKIGERIGEKCHLSSQDGIKNFLPYLKIIFKHNEKMASSIEKWFELDEEMVSYIRS